MLKVRMTVPETGRKLVLLGLSRENLERLQKGQPIKFAGEEINIPTIDFGIVFGETEQAILDELVQAQGLRPDAKVNGKRH